MSLQANGKDTSIVKPDQGYDALFPGAKFKLLCAFRTQEDFIGWEWIDKLATLSNQDGQQFFECTARVKGDIPFKGIKQTKDYFNAEFYKKQITSSTEKIWICGPPVMQAKIYEDLKSINIPVDKIFYV